MRVTNSMMISNMLSNLNKNLNVKSRRQDELSTGHRVIFASDDPVATAKILKFKTDLADMTQYSTNSRDAQAWLDSSESTIAEMGEVLQRMRELAVKSANGTNTPSDTQKIEEEIKQLKEHLITGGNTNFAGRYLFSSYHTDMPLLNADGTYNIPITAEDLATKPVSIYEVGAKERMPVGTHGLSLFGFVTDTSTYQTDMPDDLGTGLGAQKAAVKVGFDLTNDYSADTTTVSIDGTTYTLDNTKLNGTATKPLKAQDVLDLFNKADDGSGGLLKDHANVYFDTNMNLVIRSKTSGTTSEVTLSAFSGMSNPVDISNPNTPVAMGAVTDTVNGLDLVNTTVTSANNYATADIPDFLGKQFVMTHNGITKVITIPNDATITTDAQLQTAFQTQIDNAFGSGKVSVSIADGTPISFQTTSATSDTTTPELRIQPVKGTESQLIKDVNEFITALDTGDTTTLQTTITKMDTHLNNLLAVRADIGARGSRLELINSRISENSVTYTRLLSDAQDADMSEVIMYLKNAENVYKSALSVGGRIIQQTLVDFMR